MTSDELATLLWNAALWIEMNDTPDSGTEMQEDLIGLALHIRDGKDLARFHPSENWEQNKDGLAVVFAMWRSAQVAEEEGE